MQLREAADSLGVHYQTAYGWVRDGLLPARKVGRGYEVAEADVLALSARRSQGSPPAHQVRVRDWAAQADQLYAAIAAGAETRARNGLDRLAGGVPLIDLCHSVIGPALRRIGADWAAGLVTIAQEHRASAICERLLAVHARQPPGRPRGVAVVATPPGERHGLAALMAAACLREDRWQVHHLAADLPVEEVSGLASEVGASLIVFSCTTATAARRGADAARQIAAGQIAAGQAAAGQAAAGQAAAGQGPAVLAGRPGDSLHDLIRLARDVHDQRAAPRGPPRT
jgi:excisionase family DNA binding protein